MRASTLWISLLSLALLPALAVADPAEAAARRLALVIGNSTYQQVSELTNPQNDAADIAEKLRSLSFDVMLGTNL
ncbi:MAG: caspase family protein, partial [Hyphomicrobium sp.]